MSQLVTSHCTLLENVVDATTTISIDSCCNNDGTTNHPFSCDLVENAKMHIQFLNDAHNYRCVLKQATQTIMATSATVLSSYVNHQDLNDSMELESIRRYIHLWLPMIAEHIIIINDNESNTDKKKKPFLIPPPDIAWAWHCHRLAPKQYKEYCVQTFGRTIEADPSFSMIVVADPVFPPVLTNDICEPAMNVWMERYPNENFFLEPKDIMSNPVLSFTKENMMDILSNFDLLECVQRQDAFLWQVSGERYNDNDFLQEGVENYYKFLKLVPLTSVRPFVLVPTYQIDLMWHTHILSSIELYNKDCMSIMNMLLYHDDSYTDRSDGGILDVSYTATKKLWEQQYGVDLHVDGGMYRGEPPSEFYTTQDWSLTSMDSTNFADYLLCECADDTMGFKKLIGKVGASSTGLRMHWATADGYTSSGRRAFIPRDFQVDMSSLPYERDYVLGKCRYGAGYFHLETREANMMLYCRVYRKLQQEERGLAFMKSCCGTQTAIQLRRQENKVMELKECHDVLLERLHSFVPIGTTKTTKIGPTKVYDVDGTWKYPLILYACAGGACGAEVCIRNIGRGRGGAYIGKPDSGGGGGSSGCGCGGCGGG